MLFKDKILFLLTGYRSVPLKNGFSEELEMAALLVQIEKRNPKVSGKISYMIEIKQNLLGFFIRPQNFCHCIMLWVCRSWHRHQLFVETVVHVR